jgi:hypothetical protein
MWADAVGLELAAWEVVCAFIGTAKMPALRTPAKKIALVLKIV